MTVLASCFPVALLEVSFGMTALPVLLFFLTPGDRDEEQAEKPKPSIVPVAAEGANALSKYSHLATQMRSLFTCLGLIFAVNLLPLIIQVSAGLVEACTVVLFVILGHLLLRKTALVHAQRQAQRSKVDDFVEDFPSSDDLDMPTCFGVESLHVEEDDMPGAWVKEEEQEEEEEQKERKEDEEEDEEEGAEDEVEEKAQTEVKTTKRLVWADIEEEDDVFQQELARNQPEYGNMSTPTDASISSSRTDSRSEGSRRNDGRAGGKRRKDGSNGGKGQGSNRHGKEEGSSHSSPAAPFTSKIRACGRNKDLAGALEAVEDALASGLPNNSEVQNALLYALVHCGEGAGTSASELFEQMKETKQADIVSFNIMLRSYLDDGAHDKAKELLRDMSSHGLTANKVTLNELLGDRVKAGDRVGMWRVVAEMRSIGFGITNVACSLLLKALVEGTPRDEIKKTLALLDELVEPMDEALCSSAIEACLRVKELELASNFMSSLGNLKAKSRSAGLSPATYGSMIKAHGQAGDLDQTWATWNAMFKNGATPSAVTFGCMVEALVMNSCVDDAWKLVHEVLSKEDCVDCVNTVIYSTVMKGFSHARRPEQCFAVLDEMRARGVEANTITYNTLLDACAKCSEMARVPEVFEEMKRSRIEPDKITYSTLIKGYCMVGELDCAFDLFEEMKADGKVGLDEIVYNALIDGCGRQQKVARALQVLADMKKARISPSNYTLSILVKLLGRAHKLNEAINLVDDFRTNYRVRPNVQVYTCLMQACLLNKRVGQALTVYNKMVTELQCLPDQKAFSVLLNGCIQAGALKEAVQVARCAYSLRVDDLVAPEGNRKDVTVGVEHKFLYALDGKLRHQKLDADVMKSWEEVTEKAGCRLTGRSIYSHYGDDRRGDDRKGDDRKGEDRGRKGSGRQHGKGKGKDYGKDRVRSTQ